jgi:hypothetical protein
MGINLVVRKMCSFLIPFICNIGILISHFHTNQMQILFKANDIIQEEKYVYFSIIGWMPSNDVKKNKMYIGVKMRYQNAYITYKRD